MSGTNKIAVFVAALILCGGVVTGVRAADVSVNSYELFWPLVAGKTVNDGFSYKLKLWKESLRGSLIFGSAQKANYQVFLATKRLLEVENLVNENKLDLAKQTLIVAQSDLENAQRLGVVTKESKDRLENLKLFVPSLKSRLDVSQVALLVDSLLGQLSGS